jgi:alkylation response protein AidB-like acyl-CoA dehydrogenase
LREALDDFDTGVIDEWERDGHVHRTLFEALGAAGCFEERWEQGRVDGLPYAVVLAEETSRISGGVALAVSLHSEIFLGALARLAANDFQRDLHTRALRGDAIGCLASTEPAGGSDLLGLRTSLTRTSDGWHLKGDKRYISNAGCADHALVVARDPTRPPARSVCLVVIPLDFPGVEVVGFFDKLGIKACDAAHLRFDAAVPQEMLLGSAGAGFFYVSSLLQHERITISAGLLAVARICLAIAVAFARQRTNGDGTLIERQALRHRFADAKTATWAGEAMLASVISAARAGRNVSHETAALKLYCANTAGHVIDECLQILGGRGYTTNFPIERYWRDSRLARIGGGTDEVMREVIGTAVDRPDQGFDALIARLGEADIVQQLDGVGGA